MSWLGKSRSYRRVLPFVLGLAVASIVWGVFSQPRREVPTQRRAPLLPGALGDALLPQLGGAPPFAVLGPQLPGTLPEKSSVQVPEVAVKPPRPGVVDKPPVWKAVGEAPLPGVVDNLPVLEAVGEAPLPGVVDNPPIPEAVEDPLTAEAAGDASVSEAEGEAPLPGVVDNPPVWERVEALPVPEAIEEPPLWEAVAEPPIPEALEELAVSEVEETVQ